MLAQKVLKRKACQREHICGPGTGFENIDSEKV